MKLSRVSLFALSMVMIFAPAVQASLLVQIVQYTSISLIGGIVTNALFPTRHIHSGMAITAMAGAGTAFLLASLKLQQSVVKKENKQEDEEDHYPLGRRRESSKQKGKPIDVSMVATTGSKCVQAVGLLLTVGACRELLPYLLKYPAIASAIGWVDTKASYGIAKAWPAAASFVASYHVIPSFFGVIGATKMACWKDKSTNK